MPRGYAGGITRSRQRAVTPATVPGDSGTPNSSASARAVRSPDRNRRGMQADDDRRDPRPVLGRCLRPGRGSRHGPPPAGAFPLDELALGPSPLPAGFENPPPVHGGDRPETRQRTVPVATPSCRTNVTCSLIRHSHAESRRPSSSGPARCGRLASRPRQPALPRRLRPAL